MCCASRRGDSASTVPRQCLDSASTVPRRCRGLGFDSSSGPGQVVPEPAVTAVHGLVTLLGILPCGPTQEQE